jgi:hypothetical protein
MRPKHPSFAVYSIPVVLGPQAMLWPKFASAASKTKTASIFGLYNHIDFNREDL